MNRAALRRWLLQSPESTPHTQQPWSKVMCLTGVDYFSTLGYQPGIAALAAGLLSPLATLFLVLFTLLGALPVYWRVAAESPHGEGSVGMLERLLKGWTAKLVVLVLLGFAATDFMITITLSAADASAHIIGNPLTPGWLEHPVLLTLVLIALLGGVFLLGFREAIGVAVVLVVLYLGLSLWVIGAAFQELLARPELWGRWGEALALRYPSPGEMALAAVLVFPQLALGLSGFETGVVVMPQVRGAPGDSEAWPRGRVRNTRKLLLSAALIMSLFLLGSSLVTTLLIPPQAFQPGGAANGRALAYLAHTYLPSGVATLYDLSTILILWFAGASAMAGLLNLVPRYLPRYGMAPEWTRIPRPLVLFFTGVAFFITLLFQASVDAQGAAYATGVLALMTSASLAVWLTVLRRKGWLAALGFALITLVFIYTWAMNVLERSTGLWIALLFIAAILGVSFVSRILRAFELRVSEVEFDEEAKRFIDQAEGELRLIAHHRERGTLFEYSAAEEEMRHDTHLPGQGSLLFLEIGVLDPSEFSSRVRVIGVRVGPYRVLRTQSASVPNAIAAILLYMRDQTGQRPHVYLEWGEHSPFQQALRFLFWGEGDIGSLTHEILRRAEPDPSRRPVVHVGG
ncbi:MAG: amino acid transporter [Meiothermus sp.]|uniref:amino acid transporter n=1 Tax=Meiothermus sp. TaxID=1955249 RepID=UPI0025D02EFE|nr:amino acid transporter [Meiothermus sp.]MCS7069283.1 amino acid transporter [Meiothermus sp.]MDW8426171.1 amino acid transporter [Meiothermus sp.]